MSWTRDKVLTELVSVLKEHIEEVVDVTERTELVADLGIDSLGVMELVADLEDKFEMTIADADLRDVTTLGDVAGAIETRLRQVGRLQL